MEMFERKIGRRGQGLVRFEDLLFGEEQPTAPEAGRRGRSGLAQECSRDGMQIEADWRVPLNSRVTCRLVLGAESIDVSGVVSRIRAIVGTFHRVSVHFFDVTEDQGKVLDGFNAAEAGRP